jgi:hypothetical protein
MGFTEKNLHKSKYPLIGFGGKRIEALGKIELNVTFGEGNTQRTEVITFDVVDITYPYNAIFGRNSIIKFAAVINQAYLCMKIPTAGGVITILGNQEARRCEDNAACTMKNVHAIEAINNEFEEEETKPLSSEWTEKKGVMPAEHTKNVLLCEDVPDRTVTIGKGLEEAEESRLIHFLRNNQDVFAWSSSDLRGVSQEVMEHELKVDPKVKPRKQRLCTMSEDRKKATKSKVQKLLDAGVIHEGQYPEWLANVVMVPKKNSNWKMCIDFTTLNKFCPKDEFPLPRIDTLVDAAAGSEMLSMLDCFSGYHQIFMKKSDEEKTSLTTLFGTYCYVRMPEGLRNAGCTFNRTIIAVLDTQLDRNISAYVDDVVVRSKKREDHIADLRETFANLHKHGLKLNPEKCVFGVRRGKLLGCMIIERGIEANPVKIEAITRMRPPSTKKEV